MVKLYTSSGSFEYTGCNNKVTVEQLKTYLQYNGITYASKVLKKDLCHIVNKIIRNSQQIKQKLTQRQRRSKVKKRPKRKHVNVNKRKKLPKNTCGCK